MSEHGTTYMGKRFFSKSSHFVPLLLAFTLMLMVLAFFLRPLFFGEFRTHIPIDSIVEFFHGNVKEERLVDAMKEILASVASEK